MSNACKMFFSRKAVVNGLMTLETEVIYFILDLKSQKSTSPTILLPPLLLIPTSISVAS